MNYFFAGAAPKNRLGGALPSKVTKDTPRVVGYFLDVQVAPPSLVKTSEVSVA